MAEIEFSKEEKDTLTKKLQAYFQEELGEELGMFDAQFLLDFISQEIGTYFYNRGLHDAQAVLQHRLDDVIDAIYDLEKITEFRK